MPPLKQQLMEHQWMPLTNQPLNKLGYVAVR
jgi:hypothetical protein